jgi:hypothetical protein
MGKKKSRDKQISKGQRRSVNPLWSKMIRLDYRGSIQEQYNKYQAFLRGKNVMLTIENPNKNETNKKYIKVPAREVWRSGFNTKKH